MPRIYRFRHPFPEIPNYRYGGELDRPEMGCEWNGTPIRCDLLGSAIHLSGGTQNLVGIAFRHQGYTPSLHSGPNPYAFRTATAGTRVDIRMCSGNKFSLTALSLTIRSGVYQPILSATLKPECRTRKPFRTTLSRI